MEDDYCTCFPDRVFGEDIGRKCCKKHDKRYYKQKTRVLSDLRLGCCVAIQGPFYKFPCMLLVGIIMFIGVYTVGWFFYIKAGIKRRRAARLKKD